MKKLDPKIRPAVTRLLEVRGIRGVTAEQYAYELTRLRERVINDEKAERCARIFSILSDPVRVGILKLLWSRRRLCVCELMLAFNLSQPAASYHLKQLRDSELVKCVRRGKWVFYEPVKDGLTRSILKLIDLIAENPR